MDPFPELETLPLANPRGEKLSAVRAVPYRVIGMTAYQAERSLRQTVGELPESGVDHLLVVDDWSLDWTVSLAHSLGLDVRTKPPNGGYGASQKACYKEALQLRATVVIPLHPHYQYDPRAVPRLIAPIVADEADMTFRACFADHADPRRGGMSTDRYYGNRLATWTDNGLLGTQFTETHSGMRAYSRAVLMAIPVDSFSDDFLFDTQMLVAVHKKGFRIAEGPIPTRYTRASPSIGIRRSLVHVTQTIRECRHARPTYGHD